jgi:FKBP-type peptidyl-prolyl cis-trans isomerase
MKMATARKLALVLLLCAGSSAGAWAAGEGFTSAAGGLRYKDLKVGEGEPAATGQIATIHFKGWIDENGAQGREMYSTYREGQPVSFVIGTDGVMAGWNEGVLGMKPGGKRLLLIPPGMAYGNREIEGVAPANASLMFHIELIEIEDQDP